MPSRREHRREWLTLIIAFVLALASFGAFGYWALSLADQSEVIDVVVAARTLTAPRTLTNDDVRQERIRRDAVPSTAVARAEDAVGLTLIRQLSEHEFVTTNALLGAVNPDLVGLKIDDGSFGFVLPASWLVAPMPKVKNNDRVTVLVSGKSAGGEELNTGIILQGVAVADVTVRSDGAVESVLLPLDLSTSARLLQARANTFALTMLVDGVANAMRAEDEE